LKRSEKTKKPRIYYQRVADLRKERGDFCECKREGCHGDRIPCKKRNGLEFAHIAPTGLRGRGRGQTQRYYDIKRHPECYELLCDPCHWKQEVDTRSDKERERDEQLERESHVDVTEPKDDISFPYGANV